MHFKSHQIHFKTEPKKLMENEFSLVQLVLKRSWLDIKAQN